ncbi:eEF1A lysine and N-terminal methyltransferase [Triticum urartu]|uniref:Methyltransferase-like protein 13 n=1 Tax=Triticum urartu TaxID=4572 RepID=A0A8R7R4C1_TRIUA|nr:eEF1A lysine and N-terminal methyltransferase [Triticum urartu]
MAVCAELSQLQHIEPSRFISFSFPNPLLHDASNPYGNADDHAELLRVAVIDSPAPAAPSPPSPRTAAMLVPAGRHCDWIFSTRAGQLHLLLSSRSQCTISRLILVGPEIPAPSPRVVRCAAARPDPDPARARLLPLLLALCPRAAFGNGAIPDVPLLSFHDDLLRLVPVQVVAGPVVGEMLVEDVAVDCAPGPAELRRRLRFKRMPCLIQTQVRLARPMSAAAAAASSSLLEALEEGPASSLQPEVGGPLVQPYLQAMVAGLALIDSSVEENARSGARPRCLCAGVGGGALPMSIRVGLGFDVLGVEADCVVLDVARNYFGLVEDEFLHVRVGDAIQMVQDFAHGDEPDSKFSAIMVDLDSPDAMCGVSAPPLEMTHRSILLAARRILHHHGVLVLNVIPPAADASFYKGLIDVLHQVFSELHEIDVGNGENFVLVARVSPTESTLLDSSRLFRTELRKLTGDFLERIRKVEIPS